MRSATSRCAMWHRNTRPVAAPVAAAGVLRRARWHAAPMISTQVRLARRPHGEPDDSTFALVEEEVPDPVDGQVLLRVVYLSLDPYMRGRMSAAESYAAPVEVGDVLVGGTVCEVVESRNPEYAVGDVVLSYSGWQSYALSDGRGLRKLDP